jgi:signal transduction histidine kinase
MKNKALKHLGTRISLLVIIFIIMLASTAILTFAALRAGLSEMMGSPYFLIIFIIILASVVTGSVVSISLSRFPLNSIREMIDAIDRLSLGDFSVRIHITAPKEFRELGESLNRMAKELGSIELLRTDFVNNFSHEFKTPIVSMKGFAEMLKSEDLSAAEREEYLDIIISESKRLTMLATNILDLSKLENQSILSGQTKFDLSEQIRRAVLLLESKWNEKSIRLDIDAGDFAYTGNEDLLNLVWVNLIGNAVKFTPEGGKIKVRLKKADDVLQFVIQDNGCGFDEEALAHIFDKFYQADLSHAAEGNGLGLALAKKVVDLHGGTIAVGSQKNHGTEFTVTLPTP